MDSSPARIFVLWHPDFAAGSGLAASIFNWFRTPDALGLPVYYRSAPDPRRDDGLPPPIPIERDSMSIVIVLAEYRMVRDRVWRDWLERLGDVAGQKTLRRPIMLYPVALHPTGYKLPPSVRAANFIRVRSASASPGQASDWNAVKAELRTSLTEALARILGYEFMRSGLGKAWDLLTKQDHPKVKIFLSHSKRDGADVAKRIRDYIYRETQLSAFFDENDIALGSNFADVLNETLRGNSLAAMIAVNSDSYASRPWCRHEIELFAQPSNGDPMKGVWKKPPMLVIQSMQGGHVSAAIPEFGNAPMVRWRDGDEAACIDTLLRETIFRVFHTRVANRARRELGENQASQRVFLNWVPDPLSLEFVLRNEHAQSSASRKAAPEHADNLEVVYPGFGLSTIEQRALQRRFGRLRFRSFDEVRPRPE